MLVSAYSESFFSVMLQNLPSIYTHLLQPTHLHRSLPHTHTQKKERLPHTRTVQSPSLYVSAACRTTISRERASERDPFARCALEAFTRPRLFLRARPRRAKGFCGGYIPLITLYLFYFSRHTRMCVCVCVDATGFMISWIYTAQLRLGFLFPNCSRGTMTV